ncbi:MAG: regulatory protein RecX [Legionellaceae bacterium]|nr:regulatory protein RecX [Legionellaceae bacterium]
MNEGLDVAVRLLSQREHSAHELRKKLKQRGFSNDKIDDILDTCLQLDLQSDARFTEMLCRSRLNRGYGPLVMQQLLRQAGVAPSVVTRALEQLETEVDWLLAVRSVWQKKFRGNTDTSARARQKQQQFLRYRGFSEAMIRAFFETCTNESETV